MFQKLALFSARYPKSVVLATIAITAGALMMLGDLKIDANPYPLSRSHPSMVALQKLKTDFTGTLEVALIHIRHPETIYNPATFRRIVALTEGLEALTLIGKADEKVLEGFLPGASKAEKELIENILADGISRDDDFAITELDELLEQQGDSPIGDFQKGLVMALEEIRLKLFPIKEVTSLSTVENIAANKDDLTVGQVFKTIPATPAEWERLRASIRSNDAFRKLLVSEDEQSTGIQAETFIPDKRSDLMYTFNEAMVELLKKYPGPEETHIGGFAILSATFNHSIQQDNGRLFPLVVLIVVLTLLITFRTFGGVLLPLAVVIISIIWTLGIMVLVGVPLNMMTTMLPVFLIAIGVADGVHLVSEFKDRLRELGDRAKAVRATMEHMTLPVVMTSLTTAVGFISLAFTDIEMIQKFGIFVAVGVMAAMIFSLTFIPAALSFGRNTPRAARKKRQGGVWSRMDSWTLNALVAVSDFAVRRNRWVLAVAGVLLLVGGYGLTSLRAENDFLTYFSPDRPIVRAARALDQHMAGSNLINILVRAPDGIEDPFKEPKYLAAVDGLQTFLAKNPIVGKTLSLVDVLKRINLVLHDNDPAFNRLPKTEELTVTGRKVSGRQIVAQYLLLYEGSGGENLNDNMDAKFTTMNLSVLLTSQNSIEIGRLIESVETYAAANFPAGMTVKFAGNAEMAVTTNNEIVKTQITSLSISVVVVFFLLMLQFRSFSKGVLAILPLGVTVVLNFGVLGLLGIHLNIAIAVMSSIVIGIGVDFAIHYMSRLERELKRAKSQREAFANTMRASGKAITANAFIVALGFLALLLSDLYPLQLMGVLITQTLLFSGFATLMLIPAAASFFRPGFLRAAGPVRERATGRAAFQAGG